MRTEEEIRDEYNVEVEKQSWRREPWDAGFLYALGWVLGVSEDIIEDFI